MAKRPQTPPKKTATKKKAVAQKPALVQIELTPEQILAANAAGLTATELREIIQAEREHTEQTLANRVVYPPKELHFELSDAAAQKLGFTGLGPLLPDVLGFQGDTRDFFHGKGKRNKNRSQGKGGNKGGGKRLPDPKVVYGVVDRVMGSLPDAPADGGLIVIEWNMEFLDPTKAAYFEDVYNLIVRKGHMLAGSEVTLKGLQAIASSLSNLHRQNNNLAASTADRFVAYCGTENSRGQGVGAIVDTNRFEVLKTYEILPVKNVFGIQDLRAAFVMLMRDKLTGRLVRVVIEHLKSMRGGPDATAKVRRLQVQLTIVDIGKGKPGNQPRVKEIKLFDFFKNPIIGRDLSDHGISIIYFEEDAGGAGEQLTFITGDMNSKLDSADDVTPEFENAGYFLAGKAGLIGTQQMGPSVLDGTFTDGPTTAYTNKVTEVDCQ